MQKILIVSDNFQLVNFLQKFVLAREFQTYLFDFCYSSVNSSPDGLVTLGMKAIDVKKDVEEIISNYELVLSLHCKQIFPEKLVKTLTCINIHPGLNPYNRGWFPQIFSIINELPAGATVHLMNEKIDHGKMIVQRQVKVLSSDTSEDVYQKVQCVEQELIKEGLHDWLTGNYTAELLIEEGSYNDMDDFKSLCKLNLDHKGSLREHLNLLRGLSHGDFKNAYFLDENDNKVYLKLVMNKKIKD